MKIFTKKKRILTEEIDRVIEQMENEHIGTDEYEKLVRYLERLEKLRDSQKSRGVNPDTILIVVSNLAGIFMILHYERLNVVASKALGFVIRGRV